MFKNEIEYFSYLASIKMLVNISLLHTNRVCKGYIQVINDDGIFVSTQMGDWQESAIRENIYIPYRAISCVERGL
jgi:hypothetical protein